MTGSAQSSLTTDQSGAMSLRPALYIVSVSLLFGCALHDTGRSVTARVIKIEGKNPIGRVPDVMVLVVQGPGGERGTQVISERVERHCHVGDLVTARLVEKALLVDVRTCRRPL